MELKEAIDTLLKYKRAFIFQTDITNNDYAESVDTVLEELNNRISKDELIKTGNIYKKTIKKLNKKDDIERIKTLNARLEFIQELLLKELLNKE